MGRNAVFGEVILELAATKVSIKEKMMATGLDGNKLDWKIYVPKTWRQVHSLNLINV